MGGRGAAGLGASGRARYEEPRAVCASSIDVRHPCMAATPKRHHSFSPACVSLSTIGSDR